MLFKNLRESYRKEATLIFIALCGLIAFHLILQTAVLYSVGGKTTVVLEEIISVFSLASMVGMTLVYFASEYLPVTIIFFSTNIVLPVAKEINSENIGGIWTLILRTSINIIDLLLFFLIFIIVLQVLKFYIKNHKVRVICWGIGLVLYTFLKRVFYFTVMLSPNGQLNKTFEYTQSYFAENRVYYLFLYGIFVLLSLIIRTPYSNKKSLHA